jgi:hypothetical protein
LDHLPITHRKLMRHRQRALLVAHIAEQVGDIGQLGQRVHLIDFAAFHQAEVDRGSLAAPVGADE